MVAAPASYMFGYSYIHTILNTTIGGLMGAALFYYFSKYLFTRFPVWSHHLKNLNPVKKNVPRKPAKIFTKKRRAIIKIRERFGFPGLIILTPILLSIPLGTFLIMKYYAHRKNRLGWLSLSIFSWSVVLSTFIDYLPFLHN